MSDHDMPTQGADFDVTRADVLSYGEPTDEELAAINAHARRSLARSDVFVVDARPSDTSVDSHFTRMDPDTTLANYAEDASDGVPILNSHGAAGNGYIDLPVGRSFAGTLLRDDYTTPRGTTLHATKTKPAVYTAHYLPRGVTTSSTSNDDLIRAIDAGILPDVSVGFGNTKPRGANGYWYRCDECGEDLLRSPECTHYPGMLVKSDNGKETHRATATVMDAGLKEYSHVWRGSNPSAQLLRKVAELVTRHVLSHADVADIDRVTGRHMAAALDWQALKGGRTIMTTPARQTDQQGTVAAADAPAFNNPPSGDEDARRRQILDDAHNDTGGAGTTGGAGRGDNAPPSEGQAAGASLAGVSADVSAALIAAVRDAGIELVGAQSPADAVRAVVQERDDLKPLAEDGKKYRGDLVDLYHRAGVRAYGDAYNRDAHARTAAAASTTDLLAFVEERNLVARRVYGKDTPGEGDERTETMRGAVRDAAGGRQTVPTEGPAARADTTAPTPPAVSDADADLYII